MKKVPTITSLALKALKNIYIRNQKELKFLVLKIQIVVLLDKKLRKLIVFSSTSFLSF